MLDEAVECPPYRHQARLRQGMHPGNAAREYPVLEFAPALDAAGLQPRVQGGQMLE
jgi:hypothetical protein